MTEVARGGCRCGAVRFSTTEAPGPVAFCHCSQCRKQTGLYYAAASVPSGALSVEGSEAMTWYRASEAAQRGFCSRCGSALFWRRDGSGRTSILAGVFDDGTALVADRHIYVGDKPDWYAIDDGLQRFEASD